jgi:hypothetical protein
MKIEELMKPGERVVWQGEKKGLCSLKAAALHSKWLIPAVITGVFCTSVIIMQLISFGWEETLFSPFASVYPFLMMPVWIYLYGIITRKKQKTGAARYCVTNRGVYIETGREGEESTELLYLEHLQKTRVVLNDIDRMDHLGDVVCTYDSSDTEFTIRSIPDYQEVSALIRKLSEERRAEKEKELRQRGKSAAEQFRVPTPLDRQPKYKYKRRAESLAEQAEQADRAYAETMHDVVPETEPMPEALAEALRAERSRKAKKEKKTAAVQGDPDAAFFGGAVAAVPAAGELSFLDTDYASDTEVIEALPEDSVADLQSELFGAHAEQQGAFPDPAVNPLPFFPEQFAEPMQEVPLPLPQSAPVYGNPASPFALPPEQRGAWRMGDDPEMKSLEAPPPESDDPMHQGKLMQGM